MIITLPDLGEKRNKTKIVKLNKKTKAPSKWLGR